MAISCGFCTTALLQKISKVYAYVSIVIYLGIVIFMLKQNPRYRAYDTELGIATMYVLVVALMIVSIYGESKKQLKFMVPNLIVQLLFTCFVFFFTIFALITAAYHKIWSHVSPPQENHYPGNYVYSGYSRDYDTFVFYKRLMFTGIFASIAVINGAFWLLFALSTFQGPTKRTQARKARSRKRQSRYFELLTFFNCFD
ncbi:hypothetical protein M3Y97_01139700 [Aphelenchoides bicaudatus]|nr:hypothetical protein M3Y97_01139700 [Aphelenchoides bicaudatus]